MIEQRSLELKVGAFIVGGVILLVVCLFAIGDVAGYFQPGYDLRVMFDSANGMSSGSPVQYAGVEVGKVSNVRIITGSHGVPQVELFVHLPRSIRVFTDDEAAISTFGLLGEKYLSITPGQGKGKQLTAGAVLVGQPPVSTELVIERSNEVLTELKRTLEGVNGLVGDPNARVYLTETLQEIRDATRNWRLLGERLNLAMSHVEQGQGSLGRLVYDETLYNEVNAFVEDMRQHPWKLLARPKQQSEK